MEKKDENRNYSGNERDITTNRTEQESSIPNDLPDSSKDREKMEPEESTIDLPDVSDIPGQENIHIPPLGELADTTSSSDDEEGSRVFESDQIDKDSASNVTKDEKKTLADTEYMPTHDEDRLRQAKMDNTDFQGEALNEKGFGQTHTGSDLDVPGAGLDDANERIGEEDEENNPYSLSDDEENHPADGAS